MSQTTQRASILSSVPSLNDGDEMNSDEERTAFFESLIPIESSKPKSTIPPLPKYPSSSSTAPSSSPSKPSISLENQSESSLSLKLNLRRPLASSPSSSSLLNTKSDDRPLKKPTPNFYRDSSIRGIVKHHIPPSTSALSKKRKSSTLSYEDLSLSRPVNRGARPEISAAIVPKPPAPRHRHTKPIPTVKQKPTSIEGVDTGLSKSMQQKQEDDEWVKYMIQCVDNPPSRDVELPQGRKATDSERSLQVARLRANVSNTQMPIVFQTKPMNSSQLSIPPATSIQEAMKSSLLPSCVKNTSKPVATGTKAHINDYKIAIPPSPPAAPSRPTANKSSVPNTTTTIPQAAPPAYTDPPSLTRTGIATQDEALEHSQRDNELLRKSLQLLQAKFTAHHKQLAKERRSHRATQALLNNERAVNKQYQVSTVQLQRHQAHLRQQLHENGERALAAAAKDVNLENSLRISENRNQSLSDLSEKYKSDFEASKQVNIKLLEQAKEHRQQRSDIIEAANKAKKQIEIMKEIIDRRIQESKTKTEEISSLRMRLRAAEMQNESRTMR